MVTPVRYLSKFESADGSKSFTFPLARYQWQPSQSLRDPQSTIAGAHYAFRHRQTGAALKDVAQERVRFTHTGTSSDIDADIDTLKSTLFSIGQGKLWTLGADGSLRWAWASLAEMPDVTVEAGRPRLQPAIVAFNRWSDWFGEAQRVYQFDIGASGDTFTVRNNGNAQVRHAEFRLRAQANVRLASGDAITDAVRRAGVEGDGRAAPDSSVGIWEETTNAITNGGFETSTTPWVNSGAVLSRITSAFKFGSACGQIVTNNAAANEGAYRVFGPNTAIWTVSVWVKSATNPGATIRLRITTDIPVDVISSAPFTLTTDWQRITLTTSGNLNLLAHRFYIETDVQQDITFEVDGAQAEPHPLATPYVETDGATATRSASDVQIPVAGLFTETQGWGAFRVRMGWGNVAEPGVAAPTLFEWGDASNDRLAVLYIESTNQWETRSDNAGSPSTSAVVPDTLTKGDERTVIFRWTAVEISLSVNGAAFVNGGGTQTRPTLDALNADIGRDPFLGRHIDSDFFWAAFGSGTLTDADAAAIHAFGNTDPSLDELPGDCTRVWTADGLGAGTTYFTNPNLHNLTTDEEFSSTTDADHVDDELRVDTETGEVEFSDFGTAFVNDLAQFSRGAAQVDYMTLDPSANAMRHDDGGTPNYVLEVRFHDAWD